MPRAQRSEARSRPVRPAQTGRTNARRRVAPAWTRLSDEELLGMRFCDLGLELDRTPVSRKLKRLYGELRARGLDFEPHVWLAEEWFSPDGVPGFAVPFYLAHPRLERLERRIMRHVEGGNDRSMMRILRHEAGHAVDNAYRLRRLKRWREVFGPASLPYPHRYRARPGSRRYVHHLGEWYAQAHPTEDFAETFAVWLKPKSDWRTSYAHWPAFAKLRFVDEIMAGVRGRRPVVRNRERVEPLDENRRTLAQHYRLRLERQRQYRRGLADELLQKVFTTQPTRRNAARAATLLRNAPSTLAPSVAREEGVERYSVEQLLRMLIERSERLNLFVRGNRRDALRNARWALAEVTRTYAQSETPHLAL
jgi:hypothetical protein